MENELKYGPALEKAGFKLEKLDDDLFMFDVPVYALSKPDGHSLGFYWEACGLPVVDSDLQWEVAHDGIKALALLTTVLPGKTLAIDCSDYGLYFDRNDKEQVNEQVVADRIHYRTHWADNSLMATVLYTIATV